MPAAITDEGLYIRIRADSAVTPAARHLIIDKSHFIYKFVLNVKLKKAKCIITSFVLWFDD